MRWRLVLWGVFIGIPVSVLIVHSGGPTPEFTGGWAWTLRAFAVIAFGVEIVKWFQRS